MLIGAIEAGGTKFIYGVGTERGDILERFSCPTTRPEETLLGIIDYFKSKDITSLGLSCFGPINPRKEDSSYGYILKTPKEGWSHFNIVEMLEKSLGVPIFFDTDVNGAVLAENKWGAGKGKKNCLYLTIGTGIGGGAVVEGNLVHGSLHPEMGHIKIAHSSQDDFAGCCPFHKDCLEGLASGFSMQKRWGKAGYLLEDEFPWDLEAFYLAQGIMNYILILAPEVIILGGGVMKKEGLLEKVRDKVAELLNGYFQSSLLEEKSFITLPHLGDNAGILGAIALTQFP